MQTKLKGTLAEMRDLPEYPHIAARSMAGFNLVLAILQGLVGITFVTQVELLDNIVRLFGFLANSLFNVRANTAVLASLPGALSGIGMFLVIQAVVRLYIAIGIYEEWPGMWLATTAVSVWSFYAWAQLPEGILTYIALLISGVFSVLLIFDKRVQAYFKVGPFKERYWSWIYDRQRRKPVPATPWEYEITPSSPL